MEASLTPFKHFEKGANEETYRMDACVLVGFDGSWSNYLINERPHRDPST